MVRDYFICKASMLKLYKLAEGPNLLCCYNNIANWGVARKHIEPIKPVLCIPGPPAAPVAVRFCRTLKQRIGSRPLEDTLGLMSYTTSS